MCFALYPYKSIKIAPTQVKSVKGTKMIIYTHELNIYILNVIIEYYNHYRRFSHIKFYQLLSLICYVNKVYFQLINVSMIENNY